MSTIGQLFVAMTTRDSDNSGTDSSIVLIANVKGTDIIQYTFPDTSQDDQDRGQANLYNLAVSDNLDSTDLPSSYFRVGTRGDDAWRPEHFFLWGTDKDFSKIVPIAFRFDTTSQSVERLVDGVGVSDPDISQVVLSTDNSKGDLSFPLLPIAIGDETMPIKRLLVLITTADKDDAGTNDNLTLEITVWGHKVGPPAQDITYKFPGTSQSDLKKGQANWYFVPIATPFVKSDLIEEESFDLSTDGDDAWLPESIFIFGLDTDNGMPNSIVPLVHMQNWTRGALSTDDSEGHEDVSLTVIFP